MEELTTEIDSLKTTLHEDLEYQFKLEDRLEHVRVATHTPAPDVGNYARGFNRAMWLVMRALEG